MSLTRYWRVRHKPHEDESRRPVSRHTKSALSGQPQPPRTLPRATKVFPLVTRRRQEAPGCVDVIAPSLDPSLTHSLALLSPPSHLPQAGSAWVRRCSCGRQSPSRGASSGWRPASDAEGGEGGGRSERTAGGGGQFWVAARVRGEKGSMTGFADCSGEGGVEGRQCPAIHAGGGVH